MMEAEKRFRILEWDWKEAFPIGELADVVDDLSRGAVQVHEIGTGSDRYAIVLTAGDMTAGEVAQAYVKRHEYEDET
jgi:hypothetical protein